jgi:hypothetical protein
VRRAVAGSLVVHAAVIFAVYRLPTASTNRGPRTITVEVNDQPRPLPPIKHHATPVSPPPTERSPQRKSPTKWAMRPEPPTSPRPPEPETARPEPPNRTPPSVENGKPHGPVDLTLHSLPPGQEPSAVVSENGTVGTLRAPGGGRAPWKPRGSAGDPILGKLADKEEEEFPLHRVGPNEYKYDGKAFSAHIASDGQVSFDNKSIRDFKGLSGGFDVTDLIMRGRHEDPYRYQKEKFMHATEALRTKLAQSALRDRQRASLDGLPSHLERIWRAPRSAKERRALLFALWKETLTSDAEMIDAAKEARGLIEEFVRQRLPAGSEDGFTDEELERYNRGSSIKFTPYR